ncbi:MAG: biopolymer transporter ExbD [Planctomycetes bacterium]|nr:biopolymer transporter ExbD [Planctomycetota bacterium]
MPRIDLEQEKEEKANMTPMIDIVFLLLVFFILTTTFSYEDWLKSLLNTQHGSDSSPIDIERPPTVRITILPAGLPRNAQPSELEQWLKTNTVRDIVYSIGGKELRQEVQADKELRLEELHKFIGEHLVIFEERSALRKDESPVEILCYSGMAWHDALSAYDAVRSYEREIAGENRNLINARKIDFAAPELRDSSFYPKGNEIYRLQRTHAY